MRITCRIDQREALRQGIDAPEATATIDIYPSLMSEEDRILIVSRLTKDLCVRRRDTATGTLVCDGDSTSLLVVLSPTLDAILRTIRAQDAIWAATQTDKLNWIAEHGSDRLQRLVAEGIKHDAVYYEERLAAERPGWAYRDDVRGVPLEVRNAKQEGLTLLDEARKIDGNAKLVWWTITHWPQPDWRGYVCVGEFLGRETVYGVPDEYTTHH